MLCPRKGTGGSNPPLSAQDMVNEDGSDGSAPEEERPVAGRFFVGGPLRGYARQSVGESPDAFTLCESDY